MLAKQAVIGQLRDWLAETGLKALAMLPDAERGVSSLLRLIGRLLQDQGKLDEAEPLYREALAACRETLGDRHPSTLRAVG